MMIDRGWMNLFHHLVPAFQKVFSPQRFHP